MLKKSIVLFLFIPIIFLYGCSSSSSYESKDSVSPTKDVYTEVSGEAYDENKINKVEVDTSKIVKSGSISIRVDDLDQILTEVKGYVNQNNGYIDQLYTSNTYSTNNQSFIGGYTIQIRIPSNHFESTYDYFKTLGDVVNLNTYTENVTNQYVDLTARLKVLTAKKERLEQLLSKAETIEQILMIEREMSDNIYQIEYYQGLFNALEKDISYSTIDLNIVKKEMYEVNVGQDNIGSKLKNTLIMSFNLFVNFIILTTQALIILVPYSIFAVLAYLIYKWFKHNK